jgi:hypothetical protein
LSPTLSAVVGSTLAAMTSCIRSVSVQKRSSPKVSKRNTSRPSSMSSLLAVAGLSPQPAPISAAARTAAAIP